MSQTNTKKTKKPSTRRVSRSKTVKKSNSTIKNSDIPSTKEIFNIMEKTAFTHDTPIAIFTMGIPGSGKTTVSKRFITENLHEIIPNTNSNSKNSSNKYTFDEFIKCNPDEIMEYFKDYDPNHPEQFLGIASRKTSALLNLIIKNDRKFSFVYDGTGSNASSYLSALQRAKSYGYTIVLIYVTLPVETAIKRASGRTRNVNPEDIIRIFNKLNTPLPLTNKKHPGMLPFEIYKKVLTKNDYLFVIDNS